MDYCEHLLHPLSLRFVDKLVLEVLQQPEDFSIVYPLIFDTEIKVAWRAAWACQKISEKHPEWFFETHFRELATLVATTKHGGLQRGCISVLLNLPIPEPIPVDFLNHCFECVISPKVPIAVQAISMKILYRICRIEPAFIPEFIVCLESVSPDDFSKGYNAARRNILKKLIPN